MSQKAQRRKQELEIQRTALMSQLDNPNLNRVDRMSIALLLRENIDDANAIDSGDHPLRGNTTTENQPLFDAVQRELKGGKVIR